VLLRGTGENAAVGLYINDFPSTLDGFAKVNTLTSWDPNFGIMIPSYYKLSGGYTVAATMVPSPFRVTESAPDASGTVTYTAEPLYGLKFINPPLSGHLPAGDLVWKFFPGDSLPDEPDFSWPGEYVYECERKIVCNYRPSGPGRMQVSAYVEMQTAYVRSKPAAPPATLAVACRPDTLVAGNTTVCTASATPSPASLTITSWAFVGDSLGVRLDSVGDFKTWEFAPGVCGTVTVAGTLNDAATSASARVTVLCNFLSQVTHDSTLDNPIVQQEMRRLWANSLTSGLEQGSVVLRRNGVYTIVPYQGPSTRCSSKAGNIEIQHPDTMVAFFHTHPPDMPGLPTPCPGAQPGEVTLDGPSYDDNRSVRAVRRRYMSVPGYIVDRNHVHRYGSTTLPTARWNRNPLCP
jgi:hypothetical protein